LLFPKADRRARGISYPLASGAAVAALHQLRQQTVPPFVASPRLKPSTQTFGPRPRWLTSFLEHLTRQIVLAGAFAAAVAVLATALPAWAALRHSDMPAAPLVVHSSAGVTGTAATRVEDLGITTFVGRIPFVQQLRFFDSVAGTRPRSSRFIEGAREASLAEYLQDVGLQMALPYLGETRAFKETFDVWATAVTEAQRAQAAEAESWAAAEAERAAALRAATSRPVWQAPSPIAGTPRRFRHVLRLRRRRVLRNNGQRRPSLRRRRRVQPRSGVRDSLRDRQRSLRPGLHLSGPGRPVAHVGGRLVL